MKKYFTPISVCFITLLLSSCSFGQQKKVTLSNDDFSTTTKTDKAANTNNSSAPLKGKNDPDFLADFKAKEKNRIAKGKELINKVNKWNVIGVIKNQVGEIFEIRKASQGDDSICLIMNSPENNLNVAVFNSQQIQEFVSISKQAIKTTAFDSQASAVFYKEEIDDSQGSKIEIRNTTSISKFVSFAIFSKLDADGVEFDGVGAFAAYKEQIPQLLTLFDKVIKPK